MPELPEVETIARGLSRRVTGDVIESVWLGSKPEPLKSSAAEIVATLESRRITGVRRVGKHIVFDLEQDNVTRPVLSAKERKKNKGKAAGPVQGRSRQQRQRKNSVQSKSVPDKRVRATESKAQWIVHLGMTGRLVVSPPDAEIPKHTHAIVKLVSDRELRFVDPRRFGRLSVAHSFEVGGAEPLEVQLDHFVSLFNGRKTPIKSALLNQNLLRGVGNIYADESLFRAGVRPRRRAASLTREDLRWLYLAVQEVLQEAISAGGSSVSDYVDADGEEGFFQFQHRVYGREGEPCFVCKTPIKRVVIAGRSSHYCPKCQN